MADKLRIFMQLMHKNYLVRKRNWIQTFVFQILIPIGLLSIGQITRLKISPPEFISNNTYYDIETKDQLMSLLIFRNLHIQYTPSNNITDELIKNTVDCLGISENNTAGSLDENSMINDIYLDRAKNLDGAEYIGIVFQSNFRNKTLPKLFKYKLRASTPAPINLFDPNENGDDAKILLSSESSIQVSLCLDESYINLVKPKPQYNVTISIQKMPYPPYLKNNRGLSDHAELFASFMEMTLNYSTETITSIGTRVLAAVTVSTFLLWLCIEINFVAHEKYNGINILMLMNGVSNRLNLLSWFISAVIWSTSTLVPIVLILKYFMPPYIQPFSSHSNLFIIWLAFFANVCHLIAFGLHLSSYFWKPSQGIFATILITTVMDIFNHFIHGPTVQRLLLYLGIFTPNFILSRIFQEISANENKLYGVQWSNLFSCASNDNISEGSVGVMIIFSIIGILFHFCMVIYIYAIRPGKYGVRQQPFYCFQRKESKSIDDTSPTNFDNEEPSGFEYVEPGSLEPGIRIRDLKKIYTTNWLRKTKINALRGVSIDIYKGQITALLGHNGAGKTTMISILSGLTDCTNGVVYIDDENIINGTDNIKKNVGLCPQENMVFPDLTVYQQLIFFGMLRCNNRTKKQLEEELYALLNKVNLTSKMNAYPSQLSGGEKRRLCMALAIIGDAKVLILDEPTSGLDAESKREVWDIILKMRGEKTIIISTHDMEEADILGDRVAIMDKGKLKCYGTSMFLKKLYGDGQVEVTLSIEPWCELTKIFEEINMTAQILNQDDDKIVLALPAAKSLPVALDKLENSKNKLGITGMSVSVITLEQVFIRVAQEDIEQDSPRDSVVCHNITWTPNYFQTFYGYLVEKIIFARKTQWTFWLSIYLPCISVILLFLQFGPSYDTKDTYPVSLGVYSNSEVFFHTEESHLGDMYRETIENYGGRIMKINKNIRVTEALLNYGKTNVALYRNKVIVSAEFIETAAGDVLANGFYSGSAVFSIPITINCITNAILRAFTDDKEYKIEMSKQTLPDIQAKDSEDRTTASVITMSLITFLAPAIALYVVQPLTEILCGVKQLQLMTGAPKSMYWAANFLFDFVHYFMSILLLLALFISADIILGTYLYGRTEIMITLTLLNLFGLSVLPLVYLCTFLKQTVRATTMFLTIVPIVLMSIEMISSVTVNSVDSKIIQAVRDQQRNIFMLVPHLNLAYGHTEFFDTLVSNARCRKMSNSNLKILCMEGFDNCCDQQCADHVCRNPSPYFTTTNDDISELTRSLIRFGVSSIVHFFIIFIVEQQYIKKLIVKIRKVTKNIVTSTMDEMIKRENSIINKEITRRRKGHYAEHDNGSILLVQGLRKNYGNLNAVKGISFRVKQSECFGLLGVNGAGKSTTFKMLTGEIAPSDGTVYLKQYNSTVDRTKYLSAMGYCPQQDAIIDTLNAWDHLYLFARLRGIPQSQLHSVVKYWITKLNLTPCASQPSGTYSGGNKRRLNIAMALIGNPSLVLMDEPTTGVDPAARKSLWNALKTCQNAGQSIVLTSHSMEECEVLCNRLVIMIAGQIVCVGTSQQLKQHFGAGYNIHVKLRSTQNENNDVEEIKQWIVSEFNCNLIDENIGFLAFHVVDPNATWTAMYSLMNQLKNEYDCIEDYSVLSSTLEQLFIQLTRSSNNNINNNSNVYFNGDSVCINV